MHQGLKNIGFYQIPKIFKHMGFPNTYWSSPVHWRFKSAGFYHIPGISIHFPGAMGTWSTGFYQIPGIFRHLLEYPCAPGTHKHWDFQTPPRVLLCIRDSKALGFTKYIRFPNTSWSSLVHRRFKSIGFYQIPGISRHLLEFPGAMEIWSTGFYQVPGIFSHLLEFPCAPETQEHWVLPNTWDF